MRNYREIGRNALAGAAIMGASIGGVGEKGADAIDKGVYINPKIETVGPQILYPDTLAQIPEVKKEARNIIPVTVEIPDAHIPMSLIKALNSVEIAENNSSWQTPDSGLATSMDLPEIFKNKIWIFGHSQFGGKNQLFRGLEDLEIGDEVIVNGLDLNTKTEYSKLRFAVSDLIIADREGVGETIYASEPPDEPKVYLLTSLREDGAEFDDYLLDMEKLDKKTTRRVIKGDYNDKQNYVYYLIEASFPPPNEEMMR